MTDLREQEMQSQIDALSSKAENWKNTALLASLWVRNAAFPCNQATLGTFDFRLGSGMRISEHTRYTISIMF